jgi:hypothetical protein
MPIARQNKSRYNALFIVAGSRSADGEEGAANDG